MLLRAPEGLVAQLTKGLQKDYMVKHLACTQHRHISLRSHRITRIQCGVDIFSDIAPAPCFLKIVQIIMLWTSTERFRDLAYESTLLGLHSKARNLNLDLLDYASKFTGSHI